MTKTKQVIEQTQHWLSNVIIKHSICPFAKREFEKKSIHYEIINSAELTTQLETLILQCEQMDNDKDRETSLLIFPKSLTVFEDYLDALELATELMGKQGYEGIYQLASFHPEYCFADSDKDDASNYTNRSPYPMFHILREESIEKALAKFPNPETIPDKNIELTRELGLVQMKKILADCYDI